MKKSIIILAVVLLATLVGVAGFYFATTQSNENSSANVDNNQNEQNIKKITSSEVSQHSTQSDCWTIINGNVYDITSYIPRHPGGDNILSACGTDGTSFFNGEMAGKLGGRENHQGNRTANSQLERLQIGILEN